MPPSNNKRPEVKVSGSGVLKTYKPDLVAVWSISGENKQRYFKGELKMITRVGKLACLSVVWCMALSLILIQVPTLCFGEEITIDVAPNVLNIQSEGQVVTVHTDIAYWDVDVSAVFLNGVLISSWKADNRGNFVAKFLMDDIKFLGGLIIGDYNTLTLIGDTSYYDGAFSGKQEIKVINIVSQEQ